MSALAQLIAGLILVSGFAYLLLSLEEILLDGYVWLSGASRKKKARTIRPRALADLRAVRPQRVALYLSCPRGDRSIGTALEYARRSIAYGDYEIFVGAGPEDVASRIEIKRAAETFGSIHICDLTSPETASLFDHAAALRTAMMRIEGKRKFAFVLVHEPALIIHPLTLLVANDLIPAHHIVRFATFPIEPPGDDILAWARLDRFAARHVRRAALRLAADGDELSSISGCALSRAAIEAIGSFSQETFFGEVATVDQHELDLRLSGLAPLVDTGTEQPRIGMRAPVVLAIDAASELPPWRTARGFARIALAITDSIAVPRRALRGIAAAFGIPGTIVAAILIFWSASDTQVNIDIFNDELASTVLVLLMTLYAAFRIAYTAACVGQLYGKEQGSRSIFRAPAVLLASALGGFDPPHRVEYDFPGPAELRPFEETLVGMVRDPHAPLADIVPKTTRRSAFASADLVLVDVITGGFERFEELFGPRADTSLAPALETIGEPEPEPVEDTEAEIETIFEPAVPFEILVGPTAWNALDASIVAGPGFRLGAPKLVNGKSGTVPSLVLRPTLLSQDVEPPTIEAEREQSPLGTEPTFPVAPYDEFVADLALTARLPLDAAVRFEVLPTGYAPDGSIELVGSAPETLEAGSLSSWFTEPYHVVGADRDRVLRAIARTYGYDDDRRGPLGVYLTAHDYLNETTVRQYAERAVVNGTSLFAELALAGAVDDEQLANVLEEYFDLRLESVSGTPLPAEMEARLPAELLRNEPIVLRVHEHATCIASPYPPAADVIQAIETALQSSVYFSIVRYSEIQLHRESGAAAVALPTEPARS